MSSEHHLKYMTNKEFSSLSGGKIHHVRDESFHSLLKKVEFLMSEFKIETEYFEVLPRKEGNSHLHCRTKTGEEFAIYFFGVPTKEMIYGYVEFRIFISPLRMKSLDYVEKLVIKLRHFLFEDRIDKTDDMEHLSHSSKTTRHSYKFEEDDSSSSSSSDDDDFPKRNNRYNLRSYRHDEEWEREHKNDNLRSHRHNEEWEREHKNDNLRHRINEQMERELKRDMLRYRRKDKDFDREFKHLNIGRDDHKHKYRLVPREDYDDLKERYKYRNKTLSEEECGCEWSV